MCAAAAANGSDNDSQDPKVIQFPAESIKRSKRPGAEVAHWLNEVRNELNNVSSSFDKRQIPEPDDIVVAYSHLNTLLKSINKAIMLMDELLLDPQSKLMILWSRIEDTQTGLEPTLDKVGASLLNLSLARELREGHGEEIQSVRSRLRKANRQLEKLIKDVRSL